MGQINKLGRPTKHFSRNNGVTWWFCWRGGKESSPRRWWRGCFCGGSRQRRMCTWGSVYTDTARPQHDAETEAPSTTCSTSASHASCQPPYCTTATDTQTHRPTLPYSRTLAHSHTQTQWQVQLLQFMHLSTTTTLAVQHPHTNSPLLLICSTIWHNQPSTHFDPMPCLASTHLPSRPVHSHETCSIISNGTTTRKKWKWKMTSTENLIQILGHEGSLDNQLTCLAPTGWSGENL